jgi:DNA polymerase-3 subunit epsilon
MQRLASLRGIAELVAARPDGNGGWELSVIRSGRLAAAGHAERGVPPGPVIAALRATADVVDEDHEPLAEESECILRWLEEPGTRLAEASEPWAMPAFGAGGLVGYLAGRRDAVDPFADRRRLPVAARPARPKLTA